MRVVPIILSGGTSARLWPLSRAALPKQFLPLVTSRTMLQETALRLRGHSAFAAPIVVCHADHRFLVAEQLRAVDCAAGRVVLEPAARNTAAAVALGAQLAEADRHDSVLLVLPADHLIADVDAFHAAVKTAAQAARAGHLVALGVQPDRPHTGYGYIRIGDALDGFAGCRAIDRFVEKPDTATARQFLESGRFLWNGGMFIMRGDVFLSELDQWAPEVGGACRDAMAGAEIDSDFVRPDRAAFKRSPAISIDHAVMEHTAHGAVVPVDMGWHDIGSWAALWEVQDRDATGTVTVGPVTSVDMRNSYLRSEGPPLAAIGLDGVIVVATVDGVVVCPLDRAEEVRTAGERAGGSATDKA